MIKARNNIGCVCLVITILFIFSVNSYGFFYIYDPDARASALGGAFYSVSGDPACIFYNPAGIATIKDIQFSLTINYQAYEYDDDLYIYTYPSHNPRIFTSYGYIEVQSEVYFPINSLKDFALVVPFEFLNVGLGYQNYLNWQCQFDIYDYYYYMGYFSSDFEYYSNLKINKYSLSFAKQINDKFILGINLNMVELNEYQVLGPYFYYQINSYTRGIGYSFDVGMQINVYKDIIKIGTIHKGKCLINENKIYYDNPETRFKEEYLPPELSVELGIDYKKLIFNIYEKWIYWENYQHNFIYLPEEFQTVASEFPIYMWNIWGCGMEYKFFNEMFAVRGGYKRLNTDYVDVDSWNAGLGFHYENFYFDLGFEKLNYSNDPTPAPKPDEMYRFTLKYIN